MGLVLIKLVPLPESPGFQPFHKSSFNTALKCVFSKNYIGKYIKSHCKFPGDSK